ncbi:Asp-tRNA(Asn)/Glu-tRNA(Gln) amidotransferase subunit GatC [Halopenitus sp. H-Gu1]|uniref:Asp-tRNA(Asn)/Glu-tRNA(Gln) amidotransferase subunit GatC n=1 Tax=Halopenitus sp. H-Gu1 TaxID=3242697 RepID=UPI00359E3EC1
MSDSSENRSDHDGDDAGGDGEGDPVVDVEEVEHVAELARVDLDPDEREAFAEQFADILEYFDALDEVPEHDREEELVNVMRPDEVAEGLTQEEALENAPETEDGYFIGPRVS